jgi:hypothetical protein
MVRGRAEQKHTNKIMTYFFFLSDLIWNTTAIKQ